MALMAVTTLAAAGRDKVAVDEHDRIIQAIEARDPDRAAEALRDHIFQAFVTRLKLNSGEIPRAK